MKYIKLTDRNMRAYGGFQWEIGRKVTTSGEGTLCGPGWLHCYGADRGELGHLKKEGLKPEAYFHTNARANAIRERNKIALEKAESIKKSVVI